MFKMSEAVVITVLLSIRLSAQFSIGQVQSPPLTAPSGNTAAEQRCVVQGHVTNSLTGAPLKKVNVRLVRHRTEPSTGVFGQEGYAAVSEADGSFRFEGIEPGDYSLSGDRTGFLNSSLGSKGAFRSGTTLTLRPSQQVTDLALALVPQAVVSGKVVDEDGDPVGGVMVQAVAQAWMRGKLRYLPHGGTNTDDLGEFRLTNLAPGKYYIYGQKMNMMNANDAPASPDKPDIRPIRTFHPDAASRDGATAIVVKAGENVPGVDIRLRTAQTHHVRGKVVGDLPESDLERLIINLAPQDDEVPMFLGGRSNLGKERTFDLVGVAPGTYTLSLFSMNGRMSSYGRQPVEVGGSDVNGVVLSIVPAGSLRGQIHIEGTRPANGAQANLSQVRPFLMPADQNFFRNSPNPEVKADGTFVFENVTPGKYFVQARKAPDGSYLKAVHFGQQDVMGKELDLSQGVSGELDVVFRYGVAEIDGTVQGAQNTAVPAGSSAQPSPSSASVQIVLTPDVLPGDGSGMHYASANQYGTFQVKELPPGRYRAYAFEELDTNQLQNPAFLKQLESKAVDLELKENEKKQIQLATIPKADLDQMLASLGIDVQ